MTLANSESKLKLRQLRENLCVHLPVKATYYATSLLVAVRK
jgi:hypothetical protein